MNAEQVGRNNAPYRAANERIEAAADEYGISGLIPFICECADPACTQVVAMTLHDYEQIRDAYAESCAAHIRKLIGDAIPAKFELREIMSRMQDQQARITSIRYHYPPGTGARHKTSPIAITARNSAGERKRLKLVA